MNIWDEIVFAFLPLIDSFNRLKKEIEKAIQGVKPPQVSTHQPAEFTKIRFEDLALKKVVVDGLIFDVEAPRSDHKFSYSFWVENFRDEPLNVRFIWRELEVTNYKTHKTTQSSGSIMNQALTLNPKTNKDVLFSADFLFPLTVYGYGWKWSIQAIVEKGNEQDVTDAYLIICDLDKGRLYSTHPSGTLIKNQLDWANRPSERMPEKVEPKEAEPMLTPKNKPRWL